MACSFIRGSAMKKGKEFGNGRSPILEMVFSNGRRLSESIPNDTPDLRALLEQSRLALADLTQALTASEWNLTATRRTVDTLTETNLSLRNELISAEQKVASARHLAYHDALTGLPNRRLLLDRLSQAIAQASRQQKRVALVFFDVDGFKVINDKLGHAHGDKLLQEIAQRLSTCLRVADTACRYGGDEFIVLLPEIDGEESTAAVERKIRKQLAAPYLVDGTVITVTLSTGSAVYPVDAKDHRDLIKLADAAMYYAKTNGGTRISPAQEKTQKPE